jgi:acetyl esterase/lipase
VITGLVLGFLLSTITGSSVRSPEIYVPLKRQPAGLDENPQGTTTAAPASVDQNACIGVTFTRNLKYGEHDLNVVDVATSDVNPGSPHPVLMFVEGKSFASDSAVPDTANALRDAAMCFAGRNGMVGVKVTYRLAPANPWPAGAKDVAAAISWVQDNIDLFGGRSDEVVLVGYSAGAFHVASYLAHPELRAPDPGVAAVVLVSGLYSPEAVTGAAEKSYFGNDTSKYNDRSALPGILRVEAPIVLAWAKADAPGLVAQGEKLKTELCTAGHCPRTILLGDDDGISSALASDEPNKGLPAQIKEIVRELETRGLP